MRIKLEPFLGVGHPWQNDELSIWGAPYGNTRAAFPRATIMDWQYNHLDDELFMPMSYQITGEHSLKALEAAKRGPERLWLVGNEPEHGDQANEVVWDTIPFCEKWMIHAPAWAAPGCNVATPDGKAWLERFSQLLTPDFWHLHIHFQPDPQHFEEIWRWVESWHSRQGMGRPIILSEVAHWGSDIESGKALMDHLAAKVASSSILLGAFWFSSWCLWQEWHHSNLFTQGGQLSPLGEHWKGLSDGFEPHTVYLAAVEA